MLPSSSERSSQRTPRRKGVVRVPEEFPDPNGGVREDEHQSPVTSRLQSRVARLLLVKGSVSSGSVVYALRASRARSST